MNIIKNEFIPRDHISNFQVGLFGSCPARYYELYNNDREVSHIGAVLGSAIHDTIEEVSICACDEHNGRCYKYDLDYVLNKFIKIMSKYPVVCDESLIIRAKEQFEFWLEEEEKREAKVINVVIGGNKRPAVEVPFEKFLPNGILVKGFIDRIEKNKWCKDGEVVPVDWKTGYISEDYSVQMAIYIIASLTLLNKSSSQISPLMVQLQSKYYKKYRFEKEYLKEVYEILFATKEAICYFAEKINQIDNEKDLDRFLNENAKINSYCHLCSRRSKCAKYANELICDFPLYNGQGDNAQAMFDYISFMKDKEKILKKEREKVEKMLSNHIKIETQEQREVKINKDKKEKQLLIGHKKQKEVDKGAVKFIFDLGVGEDYLKVNIGSLNKLKKKFPNRLDEIEKFITEKYSDNESIIEKRL